MVLEDKKNALLPLGVDEVIYLCSSSRLNGPNGSIYDGETRSVIEVVTMTNRICRFTGASFTMSA